MGARFGLKRGQICQDLLKWFCFNFELWTYISGRTRMFWQKMLPNAGRTSPVFLLAGRAARKGAVIPENRLTLRPVFDVPQSTTPVLINNLLSSGFFRNGLCLGLSTLPGVSIRFFRNFFGSDFRTLGFSRESPSSFDEA